MRRSIILVLLLTTTAAYGENWRTFAGSFSSRWKTVGAHGHDQPLCAPTIVTIYPGGTIRMDGLPNCNPVDFARGNLDNSIGFRTGAERDLFRLGRLSLVGGGETAFSYTEYNLTQADFALLSGALTAGADFTIRGVRIGGRYGAGPFLTTDSSERGIIGFSEIGFTMPLRPGAALRITQRNVDSLRRTGEVRSPVENPRSPAAVETSVLLVASPEFRGSSLWEFSTGTGTSSPGAGIGSDRGLRSTAFNRFNAFRELPWHDLQLQIGWTSSAHESELPTRFRGYDGNFRSKTIDAFSVGLSRTRPFFGNVTMRYGGSIEGADWRDEHQLLTRDGKELVAGIEAGIGAEFALRLQIAPHVAIESGLQNVYWHHIDLGESRWSLGFVITR